MSSALRIREVSERLGIEPKAVRALIQRGQLQGFNVGVGQRAVWRVLESDLRSFVAARTHKAPTPRRRRRKTKATVQEYF